MNNKIVLTKRISVIFLSIVLIAGTITLSYPSFMIIGAAQAQPYYNVDGMDNNNYKKSYGYDTYYKPQYSSYGKDDKDKSKDSKSVDINKLNCINTNLNINGENAGDINLGNKDQVASAAEGYLGVYSSNGGYDGGKGYYNNGYDNKKDKGSDCITNNNNNNTNVISGDVGNVTDPCVECFRAFLTEDQISFISSPTNAGVTLEELCVNLTGSASVPEMSIRSLLASAGVSPENANALIACLENLGVVFT